MKVGGLEELNPNDETKILGLLWNCADDTFVFKFDKILQSAENLSPTKRNVLSVASRLFDPLGICGPIFVRVKILLQDICRGKHDWDTPLPKHLEIAWKNWSNDLKTVSHIIIPRCVYSKVKENVLCKSLHCFGDSSSKAYCANAYVVFETEVRRYVCLLTSKSRVAPLADTSIPRLELLSAVITARLYSTVRKALANQWKIDDENCQFWLDSKTALFWIKGSGEYKQFVANRVRQILKFTSPKSWRFCPGSLNPADLGTRGASPTELSDNALWWKGPPFLQKNPDQWPEDITDIEPNEENIKEMKHSDPLASNTLKTTVNHVKVVIEGKLNLENVIDLSKYSDAEKLYRITAFIMLCEVQAKARDIVARKSFCKRNIQSRTVMDKGMPKIYTRYKKLR